MRETCVKLQCVCVCVCSSRKDVSIKATANVDVLIWQKMRATAVFNINRISAWIRCKNI